MKTVPEAALWHVSALSTIAGNITTTSQGMVAWAEPDGEYWLWLKWRGDEFFCVIDDEAEVAEKDKWAVLGYCASQNIKMRADPHFDEQP